MHIWRRRNCQLPKCGAKWRVLCCCCIKCYNRGSWRTI